MRIKINCIYNDNGLYCKNKKVKRSLFGIGARCCVIEPLSDKVCEYRDEYKRPNSPPPMKKDLKRIM